MVNDMDSLCAAVKDHHGAGKNAIQLYVVKNSGKTETDARTDGSDVKMCLDITNLPK